MPMSQTCCSVIERASKLLSQSLKEQTTTERREGARLARLMQDPAGKAFTLAMVDEVFRSGNASVQSQHWRQLIEEFGVPKYLGIRDQCLLRLGATSSAIIPALVMPVVAYWLRRDSSRVILDAEPQALSTYLQTRAADGFRINLNQLGEAVLGEEEASHRMEIVLRHLKNPHVDYISIKISAIFSQIHLIAWQETLEEIKTRLRSLYRAALPQKKFVNLDMEEYRDLSLTVAAFREVLSEPEFHQLSAGIVLQGYLPDSWAAQQELTDWAIQRVANQGAEIKIRLVKGANLAMEAVEAELHGWHPAPYPTKLETDANFRRMLEFGSLPQNAKAVRLGVASHNLFDVALALELREKSGTSQRVEIEMLEGMANHQARAVRDTAGTVLLYAPIVSHSDFLGAMAYLVRRLDENTASDNFLRSSFALKPNSLAWENEKEKFIRGWDMRSTVSSLSRRLHPAITGGKGFFNEPDSDWTQPRTRIALEQALASRRPLPLPPLPGLAPTLEIAHKAQIGWEAFDSKNRAEILQKAAQILAVERFQTIAYLQAEGKKAIYEADIEVSEAIDFARYYAATFEVPPDLQANALGVVVIAPPWNFPYAIPCGGVLAALMAGNSVIIKPAPETTEIAWLLTQQLWAAGIPQEVLQFFPCSDGEMGCQLIRDPQVAAVVLTGAWETARLFQSWRPSLRLFAETSGKNALIITAQADRELAIKDLVKSAFGHAGQKCSAASLAIVEKEVYADPTFQRQLRDAAASLTIGPATTLQNIVTPLIRPPNPALLRALTALDEGEQWLLQPHPDNEDPCLWSPGIKLGIRPNSWFHRHECFGPVLGMMCAESLDEAICWQNATDYGLTAGLHSLDPNEQKTWSNQVEAGNLYINRAITGAVVQRQPFGGWKRSSIGPSIKAGGPHYVFSFARLFDKEDVSSATVKTSYSKAWKEIFSTHHDPSQLQCESNILRYRPRRGVILRLSEKKPQTIERAQLASELTGTPLIISISTEESDQDFLHRLKQLAQTTDSLRTVETPSDAILNAAYEHGLNWIDAPLTSNGSVELCFWLREQTVSQTRHRYGQIPTWIPQSRKNLLAHF